MILLLLLLLSSSLLSSSSYEENWHEFRDITNNAPAMIANEVVDDIAPISQIIFWNNMNANATLFAWLQTAPASQIRNGHNNIVVSKIRVECVGWSPTETQIVKKLVGVTV